MSGAGSGGGCIKLILLRAAVWRVCSKLTRSPGENYFRFDPGAIRERKESCSEGDIGARRDKKALRNMLIKCSSLASA